MNKVKNALNDVMQQRLRFRHMTVNSKVQSKVLNTTDAKDFLDSLTVLYNTIKQNKRLDYKTFVRENNSLLDSLRSTLISSDSVYFKDHYTKALIDEMTQLYRQIYISIKYKEYITAFEEEATRMLNEFTKGITYFASEFQPGRNPAYHRNASCGSKRLTSERNFVKTLYGPDKSAYIKRCLIERLIYDDIYKKTLRLQDIGHKYELQQVITIYDEYFPNESVKLKQLDYASSGNPIFVSVAFYNKDTLLYEESYTKSLGTNDVHCAKQDYTNDTYYEKIQTFDNSTNWIEVPKPITLSDAYVLSFE